MSHGLVRYLYYLDGYGYVFEPSQSNRVQPALPLVRNIYHTIRLQAVKTTSFDLNSDMTAPTAALPDWPVFTSAVFGLKTATNFDNGGDFAAAWSGFDTGDTAWHSPANMRYSFAVAPTIALNVGCYLSWIELTLGGISQPLPDIPLLTPLRRELITGTEPTAPSGIGSQGGTATILNGTDSITVAFAGISATGLVIPFWIGAAQSALSATATTNSFTITAGGAVSGDAIVGYYVAKL